MKLTICEDNRGIVIEYGIDSSFARCSKILGSYIPVQGMQQAQADKIDHWAFYQARNIRSEVASSTVTQLQLQLLNASGTQRAQYDTQIKAYQAIVAKQEREKEKIKRQAEDDQKTYDGLNLHDDQFDLADAAISIAISLLAVTALTNKFWL